VNLFFQPNIPQGIFYLDREESHHAVRVLRMDQGTPIDLTDGHGSFYKAIITNANAKQCEFKIEETTRIEKKNFSIHIAVAPTKNADRIEWFVEKATEIGIDEISFMLCQNSERKVINLERIEKIAVSAMKQSQQAWLPKINGMIPYKNILANSADQKFIAFVDSANQKLLKSAAIPQKKYLVLIGPEGDFSKEELEQALQNDFVKVSLGQNRLRTETAALMACVQLNW
jgi:16S rRNA (uracil1498-N3)-methyltransferase